MDEASKTFKSNAILRTNVNDNIEKIHSLEAELKIEREERDRNFKRISAL